MITNMFFNMLIENGKSSRIKLKHKPGVYILVLEGNETLCYIGLSQSVGKRIKEHLNGLLGISKQHVHETIKKKYERKNRIYVEGFYINKKYLNFFERYMQNLIIEGIGLNVATCGREKELPSTIPGRTLVPILYWNREIYNKTVSEFHKWN